MHGTTDVHHLDAPTIQMPAPQPCTSGADAGAYTREGDCSPSSPPANSLIKDEWAACNANQRATLYTAAALQLLQGSLSTESAEYLVSALQRARDETCAQRKATTLRRAIDALLETRTSSTRPPPRKITTRSAVFPSLPEELTPCILRHLSAVDLATAAGTCTVWHAEATRVAEEKLRSYRTLPAGVSSKINWARALAAEEALREALGPRPQHAWWHEWAPMRVEEVILTGQPERFAHAPLYERKGPMSIMAMLCRYAGGLSWMFDTGWPLHQAAACLLIGTFGTAALGLHLRCHSSKYAASTYAYSDAINARAWSMRTAAPLTFASIDGVFGLGSTDPAWLLLRGEVAPGTTLQTTSAVMACVEPCALPVNPQGECNASAGPIVCFHSEYNKNDLLRSLIQVSPTSYQLPPLAKITVLYEHRAGEWSAFGQKIWRRCVHVRVAIPY